MAEQMQSHELPSSGPESHQKSLADTLNGSRKRQERDSWDSEDFGDYIKLKRRKLNDQFLDLDGPKISSIFEGVTIYVNGWTQPNADELKEMIHSHGGHYMYNLYSRANVTHTIATNLPNSKIKNIGKTIVCTPAWVVDSIACGRQLPVDAYLLYSGEGGQKQLAFERKKETSPQEDQNDSNELFSGSESPTEDQPIIKAYRASEGADFVNSFFTHSRLHYLSTWSTELKQFTAKMLKQVSPRYPKLSPHESLRYKQLRAVVHIDLDCFFVSVSIRNKPHLKGKAVAVTHAKLPKSSSESKSPSKDSVPKHLFDSTSDIASCSYSARDFGIKNGMSVGEAMKRCPDLVLLPYDFEAYREVSQQFYEILLQYSSCVEAVSCDEAFIELTDYVSDPKAAEDLVLTLRNEVESKVGCTVSAGIAHNMLLARMSTRVAKPDGQFYLSLASTENFLESQNVNNLPGVGYSTTRKLKEMNIETCPQLSNLSLEKLKEIFGQKTGKILHDFARGIDERELKTETERKSVSVDINYGIRFRDISEAESLLRNLANELEKRASNADVLGGTVALKMKIRKASAPSETWKYLGHGACDNVTRSMTLLQPTRSSSEVFRLSLRLLKQVGPVASDIRGMGLQLSKLVSASSEGTAPSLGQDLRSFLKPAVNKETGSSKPIASKAEPCPKSSRVNFIGGSAATSAPLPPKDTTSIDVPPLSQLDNSVLDALPESIRHEILAEYASKPTKIASTKQEHTEKVTVPSSSTSRIDNHSAQSLGVVISNERLFLKDIRNYMQDWILHYIEGPPEEDVLIFIDYVIKLSVGNLDMMSQVLKIMRRFVAQIELQSWYSVFNQLLAAVQQSVKEQYSGQLKIYPIDHV